MRCLEVELEGWWVGLGWVWRGCTFGKVKARESDGKAATKLGRSTDGDRPTAELQVVVEEGGRVG